MCQTSSLISQTKAGEFDLSEFRSFVPMNKTSLLLDVTRTYQVTDSPLWARWWHSAGAPCAGGDRKDEAPAAYLQLWLRGKITAEDTQVYATYTDMMEIAFWSRFWWIIHPVKEMKNEWKRERKKTKVDLRFHLICHVMQIPSIVQKLDTYRD